MLSEFWKIDNQYSTDVFKVTPVIRSSDSEIPNLMNEYFTENKPMPLDNCFIKVGEHSFLNGRGRILNGRTNNYEFKPDETVTEQYLALSCWSDRNLFNRATINAYYGNFAVNPLYTLLNTWSSHWDGTDVYGEHKTDTPDYSDLESSYKSLRKIVTYDYSKMFINAWLNVQIDGTDKTITLSDYERDKNTYITFKLYGFTLHFTSVDNTTGVFPILTKTVSSDWIVSDTPVSSIYNHDTYHPYPYDLYSNEQYSCNPDYVKSYDEYIPAYILDETKIYNMLASFGHIVKSGDITIYPIINDNICDGEYTLDKNEWKSDNSTWTNTDEIPRSGSDDNKDYIEEMKSNDVMPVYGLVKYYKMTSVELAGMISEIEDLSDDKAMQCFVSCYLMPMLSEQATIYSSGINIRIAGHTLSQTADHIVANQRYTLATFTAPVRHGNAYDTLTKYYLYTPFTDVIPLDYKCYGRTITVELHPSVQDMTGSLTIKCDGMIIHKQSVSLGSALAISVENNAEKQQALINACSKYGASAMGTLGGFVTGNIPAIAGGTLGVIASTANVLNAIDRNYIHSYGTNTGASISLLPSNIYLIENYVSLDKPSNFATIHGNLANKEMTLTSGMGFTKLDKPRVSCTLTAPEVNELIQLLENGVIL